MNKIKVTSADIKYGLRNCNHNCPVALAIARQFNYSIKQVFVGTSGIFVNGSKSGTPNPVKKFIRAYDNYEDVLPFEFSLNELAK